jgi:3-oxoacyl-[acyl-carrier protein] reductase
MRFSDKVAIVTGGSQGIGKACAVRLAKEGCSVVICARTSERVREAEKEIDGFGGTAVGRSLDVSHEGQVKSLFRETVERFGKLDILISNAGVRSTIPFEQIDDPEWYRVLDINLKGTFYVCRAAMEQMKRQKFGRIVTISSIAGKMGGTLVNAPYGATKASIINMTKIIAKIMAPYSVTANCVTPGTIDTPFIEDYDEEKRELLRELIPLGRLGTAEDVAGAVLFLASDDASWITGITLDVNGGQLME